MADRRGGRLAERAPRSRLGPPEAARREAIVAVTVLDAPAGDPLEGSSRVLVRNQLAAHDRLEAQVLRAIAETGVHGRTRTAVLDRLVYEALVAATRGADLVVVGPQGKSLLRQAVPRPPSRRLARGAWAADHRR